MVYKNSLMFNIACLYYKSNLTQESMVRRSKSEKKTKE